MMNLYKQVCAQCSKSVTRQYSTSFSSAIKLLHKDLRQPIHNIYGFVRLADEIVDTFHKYNKPQLLQQLKGDTYAALESGISINPLLYSFQDVVNKYSIDRALIDHFFASMEMDLEHRSYNSEAYHQYIFGSAEVVGLMCLKVFCKGDGEKYAELKSSAQALGAAFQKVNFLRDIKADYEKLGRLYFPGVDFRNFTEQEKRQIEHEIAIDFDKAKEGIRKLPVEARLGVYVAYRYYLGLFRKIERKRAHSLIDYRVRIPNAAKWFILLHAGMRAKLGLL